MTTLKTLTLTGASGTKYDFTMYPFDVVLPPVAALYVVTKRTAKSDGTGTHRTLYVGETGNLNARFANHHQAACFGRHGANRVGVHRDSSQRSRLAKEQDLLAAYDPPCND